MAKVQNPIIGKATGSAAGMTFSSWKGLNIMRAKPVSSGKVAKPLQVSQRNKMTGIVVLMRAILPFIRLAFKEVAIAVTEANKFISKNIGFVAPETGFLNVASLPDLVIAQGSLQKPVNVEVTVTVGGISVAKTDSDVISPEDNSADELYVVMYNEQSRLFRAVSTGSTRVETDSVEFTGLGSTLQDIHVYTCYINAATGKSSDGVYKGKYQLGSL